MSKPVSKDEFMSGIFWELYNDLERQFQDFLGYVPYLEGNETVYSFKLINLILSVGGHVDSAFKEMARYIGFINNDDCKKILELLEESEERVKEGKSPRTVPITLSLRAFEKEYKLSKKKVRFKCLPKGEWITPFTPSNKTTRAPKWWEIYNGLKHDLSVNIKEANLLNTRDALAAAFLLNVRHIPGAVRLSEYRIMKFSTKAWEGYGEIRPQFDMTAEYFQDILERQKSYPAFVETPLFAYDYSK
jgi:hypothetical protein